MTLITDNNIKRGNFSSYSPNGFCSVWSIITKNFFKAISRAKGEVIRAYVVIDVNICIIEYESTFSKAIS